MKGTEQFKEIIKNYLDNRAKEDELFRAKYETTEVFSMAVHAIDELTLEIGKPVNCDVVVNRHIDLTEEEKAEQKALALKRYQEEELRKLQVRHSKPRTSKPQETKQPQPSLFDF